MYDTDDQAHQDTEASSDLEEIVVTDVNSAAQALSNMPDIFGDDEAGEDQDTDADAEADADDAAPEDQASGDDETDQDTELDTAIQAPVSWSQEDKNVFAALPPDAQNIILRRESERDTGFQQKATELADLKRQFEQQQSTIEQERQQYAQFLASKAQAKIEPPSLDLLNPQHDSYSPEKYHLQKAQYEQAAVEQQTAQQNLMQQQQEYQNQQAQAFQKYTEEQTSLLTEALPEWKDKPFRDEVLKYATTNGYEVQQLQMASAQDIQTLVKAKKYDAMMAKKDKVKDTVRDLPKVMKPGAAKGKNSKATLSAEKRKQAQKSGSVKDAARALEDLI